MDTLKATEYPVYSRGYSMQHVEMKDEVPTGSIVINKDGRIWWGRYYS